MLTSLAWLNRLLDPGDLSADEAEHVLTNVGFPIESREPLPGGDVRLDVELTSNRGDCLCHLGLAREIAAATGRRLVVPTPAPMKPSATKVESVTSVENRVADAGCPRFTARVIRGVKVGPSPAWLREALESVGQRSINNIVDVSNFVLFELGHPSHTFDLNTLRGRRLVVRHAQPDEPLVALDGRKHALRPDELVVADAERAVSLAGVIGGFETGVTERTTDVLLEMATWDPITIRRAARRLDIRTDASHRFERYVDARDLEWASQRAAALILEVAGGELLDGMIDAGGTLPAKTEIVLRAARCEHLLGYRVPIERMASLLRSIGLEVAVDKTGRQESLRCLVPHHRHDLTREVDLIEEVARLNGFDKIEVAAALDVPLDMAHPPEWSRRERAAEAISAALVSAGFFETVTFSFLRRDDAEAFCPTGLGLIRVDEERRQGEPYLRPSLIPSLLSCRRANQDARSTGAGGAGVRFFEIASTFADRVGETVETRSLALLADSPPGLSGVEAAQAVVRILRGALQSAANSSGGPAARVEFIPAEPDLPALAGETFAEVRVNGERAGRVAAILGETLKRWGLESPVGVAEIDIRTLIALYPPVAGAALLPRFPSIERDLSIIVAEETPWARFEEEIAALRPALLERVDFIGIYRGRQIGAGKKSVTFRMTFRDPDRTLRNEEVDPQVAAVVERLGRALGGVLRTT